MTKLEKVLLTVGGIAVAGTVFSLWQSNRDLRDENEDLLDENISLRSRLPRQEESVQTRLDEVEEEVAEKFEDNMDFNDLIDDQEIVL